MVKLLVFAILLASTPATALVKELFETENSCYQACSISYTDNSNAVTKNLDACKKGCDFSLHNENCGEQCKAVSTDENAQASCQVGCTLSGSAKKDKPNEPVLVIDPVPEVNIAPTAPPNVEFERPHSIILIRIRQRPSVELPSMPMPSMHSFFNGDPMQMFNEMIKQFQDRAKLFDESLRKSFEEDSKDVAKLPDANLIPESANPIPIIRIHTNNNPDSSSEESIDKSPLVNEFRHMFRHGPNQAHMMRMEPNNNRAKQFFSDVRNEWNDLIRKQPKIPIWIFLAIFLSSSALLWYMVMSLCRHTPSRDVLSIRAQELVFHPYDYEAYEKEKIQPDDQPYEVTESLPIKVKLTNI